MSCRGTCSNGKQLREWKKNTFHYDEKVNCQDALRVSKVDCYQITDLPGTYEDYTPLFVWFCWNVEFNKPQADFYFQNKDSGNGGISSLRKDMHSCTCGGLGGWWRYRRGHCPEFEPTIDTLFKLLLEGKLTPVPRIEGLTHPNNLIRKIFELREEENAN